MATNTRYDQVFFEFHQRDSRQSAVHVVPLVMDLIHPHSVIDVGCGVAPWLSVFKENGISDYLGIDGEYVDRSLLMIPDDRFEMKDLSRPFSVKRQFDLVVSLEVAEHIPANSAAGFVQSLTQLGDTVLFSAAIPSQGGTHHVNEQWPEYWRDLFATQGYSVIDCIRSKIWQNEQIQPWYRQNLLLFVKNERIASSPALQELQMADKDHILSMVHPAIWFKKMAEMSTKEKVRQLGHSLKDSLRRHLH
jgi:SAM-dependent methyltransferase